MMTLWRQKYQKCQKTPKTPFFTTQKVATLWFFQKSRFWPKSMTIGMSRSWSGQKWHFWHKRVKSEMPLRGSNYKARIHWERTQIGPKWSKTPENPILTHFGHVLRGGLSDIPEDVQNRPRSTRFRMSRPWSGSKMGFLVKNAKK